MRITPSFEAAAEVEPSCIGKISLTSPIVINVPTRASLAVETKGLLFLCLAYLNNKAMCVNRYLPYRGFARQPCCMAGKIDSFCYGNKINVLSNAKHFHCSCHATWLPCKTSIAESTIGYHSLLLSFAFICTVALKIEFIQRQTLR